MLDTVIPLHQQLEAGPTTMREAGFQQVRAAGSKHREGVGESWVSSRVVMQAFGRELSEAYQYIKRYQDLYAQVRDPRHETHQNPLFLFVNFHTA